MDKFAGATYHILVEKIENHVGKPCVTPVPMDKKELAEMFKLRNSKVAGHHSLRRQWGEKVTVSDRTDTARQPGHQQTRLIISTLHLFFQPYVQTKKKLSNK